jgi:hypothetical protein
MTTRRRSAGRIWGWPLILATLTVVGLLSALLGQTGIWLPISWVTLAGPLLAIIACLRWRMVRRS